MEEDRRSGGDGARRMSEEEIHEYRGLTLGEDGREEWRQNSGREEPSQGFRFRVYTTASMPWWKKALYLGAGAALVAAFLVVAWFFLLGGLVVAGAAAAVYFIRKYLMR